MTLSIRFLPAAGRTVLTANGRAYAVSGATVDVPYADAQAIGPEQGQRLMIVGATTDRPTFQPGVSFGGLPMSMYDTTVAGPIFLSNPGAGNPVWVNISGSAV